MESESYFTWRRFLPGRTCILSSSSLTGFTINGKDSLVSILLFNMLLQKTDLRLFHCGLVWMDTLCPYLFSLQSSCLLCWLFIWKTSSKFSLCSYQPFFVPRCSHFHPPPRQIKKKVFGGLLLLLLRLLYFGCNNITVKVKILLCYITSFSHSFPSTRFLSISFPFSYQFTTRSSLPIKCF